MPATRSKATFLLAATCGLLARAALAVGVDHAAAELELEDAPDADDEVFMLQERVLERRRSGAAPSAEQKKAKAPSVCEDGPAEMRENAFADLDGVVDMAQLMPEAPIATAGTEPADVSALPTVDSEYAPDTAKAEFQPFRYIMDALTVLLLLDGCRRWRNRGQREADGSEESPPCGSEAFQQLVRAAAAGDEAQARELLGRGAVASEVDLWGCTALHAGARGGMCGLSAELLDLGAELDAADAWDDTPLHMASRAGHAKVCELLVARGAALDAANAQAWTPLVVAGHAEHRAVCLLLLGLGAGVGGLPSEELPPLLRELLPGGEEATAAAWPTGEDWERHMQESVDDRW